MKNFLKILLIALASLLVIAGGFVVFAVTGNGEMETLATVLPDLDGLSPRSVRIEGVKLIAQPDAFTCGITAIATTVSYLTGVDVTPQSLIDKYSLGGGMKSEQFRDLLSKELPNLSVLYAGGMDDSTLLSTIHGQLTQGFPVPVFFGAENPYNKPWYDFHASVVTGMDLDQQKVFIANAYGYAEEISLLEFLNRMSYRGGSKYPFVQRAVTRLGLMDKNAVVLINGNKK